MWTSFVYVSEVSANTYAPYTSKSPRRTDVSISFLLLVPHLILPIFRDKNIANAFCLYVLILFI